MRNTNVDHIWRTLGPLGKYQCKQMGSYLLSLIAWAFQGLNIVFIGHRPDFQCRPSNNDSMVNNITDIHKEYQQCMIVTYTNTSDGVFKSSNPCNNGWEYDAPVDQSFVTEWDFVCENAELGELTQVLYLVGMMIGTFIFPTLSDRFGRKPIMVMGHVTVFGVSLATAFSGNYVIFVILRFLAGFCQQGLLAGTTLSLETLPAEIRHYCEVLALLCWTSSICFMSPIAYALRNFPWKYLQITYAMCSAWSIFQWWFTDESLRWVIANGQIGRAKGIIKNACKWNGKDYIEVMEKIGWGGLLDANSKLVIMTDYNSGKDQTALGPLTADIDEHKSADKHQTALNQVNSNAKDARGPLVRQNNFERSDSEPEVVDEVGDDDDLKVQKYTLLDIFRHKRILIVSMIMWYSWICDSFVYFGLYMTSSDLYGDRYLNFFLSAAVEYFSAFIEYLCLARIGRKWTAIIGHIIAAVGLAVATGLTYTADGNSGMLTAATAFMLIGKMGITTGYSSIYLTTPELYPTNMRNIGLGVCSFMEKVGSMIAPFSRNVSSEIKWLPPCVFAVMSLITVILFAFVPETNGVELPQTVEELSEWYRVNKFELRVGKNRLVTKEVEKIVNE